MTQHNEYSALEKEYAGLSKKYDKRWKRYISASICCDWGNVACVKAFRVNHHHGFV